MKFIEFIVDEYDEDTEEAATCNQIVALDRICSVKPVKRNLNRNGSSVRETQIRVEVSGGDNLYITNYTYEELKRILVSGGNIISTGVTR
jgi:hypothetical protein